MIFLIYYLFLAVLGLCCCMDFSLVVLCRLLIAVASLAVEHGLYGTQAPAVAAPGLQNTGSIVVAHELSCSTACEILSDQGSSPCLLHWLVDSLPLSHQGNPLFYTF